MRRVLPLFVLFCALDLATHWHQCLRAAWDFLPAARGGLENEFVTIWVAGFAERVRALPFPQTFWLLNPQPDGTLYASHPGFLTFLAALAQSLFGSAPAVLRRLALLLFVLRVGFLHELLRREAGTRSAWLGVALYLAIPATQGYAQALSYEVISATFVLGAFWALRKSLWGACVLTALAVATDWTTVVALPFLGLAARERHRPWVAPLAGLVAFLVTYFWTSAHADPGETTALAARVWNFLVGPFHVLPYQATARAQLYQRLGEAFPLFLALPALLDLARRGLRRRAWWWSASFVGGGMLVLCFLGVFRAHAYTSSWLALSLVASATAGWAWLLRRSRLVGLACVALALAEFAWRFALPLPGTAQAEARCTLRREAGEIASLVGRSSYRVQLDESAVRGKPWPLYLPAATELVRENRCADFLVGLAEVKEEALRRAEAGYTGSLLLLRKDCWCKAK